MNKTIEIIKKTTKDVNPISTKRIFKEVKRIYPEQNISEQQINDFLEEEYMYAEIEKRYSVNNEFYI